MSQASLRTVALETYANYAHAAERAVGTYRAGGHRLIEVLQRGIDRAAARGVDRMAPRLAAALRRVSVQVGTLAGKGLDAVSTSTERAIELGKAGFTARVKRVAELADGIDNRALVTGLQAAVKLSLPGAQAALAVSERVAANADTVYARVAGEQPAKAVRRVAKPVKKATKAAAPAKRSRKAVVAVAPVKAVRARRAPKAAAAEAANA